MAVISIPDLRIQIDTFINTNGSNDITGAELNSALINTVDSLEAINSLSGVLSIGNEVGDGQVITSLNGSSTLDLRADGTDNRIRLFNNTVQVELFEFGSFNVDVGGFSDSHHTNFVMQKTAIGFTLFNQTFTRIGTFLMSENDTVSFSSPNFKSYCLVTSAQNITVNPEVYNSSITSGLNTIIKTSNSTYANQYVFNNGLAGEMKIVHTPNAADFVATLKAESGTIAYISDINSAVGAYLPLAGGTMTGDIEVGTSSLLFAAGIHSIKDVAGTFTITADDVINFVSDANEIFVTDSDLQLNNARFLKWDTVGGIGGLHTDTLTGNHTWKLPNKTGVIATVDDITVVAVPQSYTTTNVVADRTYDANAITTDELVGVVGTLITDLKTSGIIL